MKTKTKPTRSITWVSLSIAIAIVGILAISAPADPGRADHAENGRGNANRDRGGYETFVLDVAIDGRTFAPVGLQDFAPEGQAPNYLPIRGTTFLIDGLILPGYTLPFNSGVVVDDYRDLSIGSWLCRGHFLHSMVTILSEGAFPHAASSEQFFFREDGIVEDDELITDGNEGGATTHRVINRWHRGIQRHVRRGDARAIGCQQHRIWELPIHLLDQNEGLGAPKPGGSVATHDLVEARFAIFILESELSARSPSFGG